MPEVVFKMSAEQQKVIQSYLSVAEAQGKVVEGHKKAVGSARALEKAAGEAAKALGSMMGVPLNLGQAAVMGVEKIVNAIEAYKQAAREARTEAGERLVNFGATMKPLLALGGNMEQPEAVRRRVLELSTATGLGVQEIARAMFDMQSGAAGLSKQIQGELLNSVITLNRLTGTDLPTGMALAIKSFQTYGQEAGGVANMMDKVFVTGERAYMTFQEMASLLPDLEPAAKALGYSFDQLGASIIVATAAGGKNDRTMTGLRNIYLRMSDAMRMGWVEGKTLADQLESLNKLDKFQIKQLFGEEAFSLVTAMAGRVKELREETEKMAGAAGKMEAKSRQQARDPQAKAALDLQRFKSLQEDIQTGQAGSGDFAKQAITAEILRTGLMEELGPIRYKAEGEEAMKAMMDYKMAGVGSMGYEMRQRFGRKGLALATQRLEAEGDSRGAMALRLRHSEFADWDGNSPRLFNAPAPEARTSRPGQEGAAGQVFMEAAALMRDTQRMVLSRRRFDNPSHRE